MNTELKKLPLLCLALFLTTSCTRQTLTSMQITQLRAVDLEETLTLRDELMLAYSLASFDASGRAVGVSNGGWGVVEARAGQQFGDGDFAVLQVPVPKNGKVVASLALVEVDDYARAQQTLSTIRKYQDFVKVPAALAELADVTLTPLKYLSLGLSLAGVGFQLADRLDKDDILGTSSRELSHAEALTTRVVAVPLEFKGGGAGARYRYELNYHLRSQTARWVRSKSK